MDFANPVFCPREQSVTVAENGTSIEAFAKHAVTLVTDAEDYDESFYVGDLGAVFAQFKLWKRKMPRVKPFYAVKANTLLPVIRTMAALGAGFDCASKNELACVLKCGVEQSRIIFASTCKFSSHITDARDKGVTMTTVDNEDELFKLKMLWPEARILVRIRTDDSKAAIKFYNKFGASVDYSKHLIRKSIELGLDVIGISFHVGGCTASIEPYRRAVSDARELFDYAATVGIKFRMLDIGGGFPGSRIENEVIRFETMAEGIREFLDEHFPPDGGVELIADPGRIFPAAAMSLVCNVIAKKDTPEEAAYYVGDGIFGAFSTGLFRNFDYEVAALLTDEERQTNQVVIYGCTLAGMDVVNSNATLPVMNVGEWLIFEEVGSYGPCLSVGLNGLFTYKAAFFIQQDAMKELRSACVYPELLPQTAPER